MDANALAAGTTFAGEFKVIKPLSQGGMGAVYVVEQTSTGKRRALKVMHGALVSDPRLRERFVQEAKVGARIESDHVVEVVDAGVDAASGMPWLAMELLNGETLAEALSRRGAFSAAEVREVFAQLGHAVSAAHQVGIVHRDLKPENVFLSIARREGVPFTVKVLDFGIAKLMAEAQTKLASTQAMGTPMWMAPEQTESGHSIKPAADVWALGLIAYNLLTARVYWDAAYAENTTPMMLLREILMEPLVPASVRAASHGLGDRLPKGFDEWFERCVVREIAARFPDAQHAREALARVLEASGPRLETAAFFPPRNDTSPDRIGEHSQGALASQGSGTQVMVPPRGHEPGAGSAAILGAHALTTAAPAATEIAPVLATRPQNKSRLPVAAFALIGIVGLVIGGVLLAKRGSKPTPSSSDAAPHTCASTDSIDCSAQCDRGDPQSCTYLGLMYNYGQGGVLLDKTKARPLFEKGCAGDIPRACNGLGALYGNGEGGLAPDKSKAFALYTKACDGGEPKACANLGVIFEGGDPGHPMDLPKAYSLLKKACDLGEPFGCFHQGVFIEFGKSVAIDAVAASRLYEKACDGGNAGGCAALGTLYVVGKGVPKNVEKGAPLLEKGCAGGDPKGCSNLATLYSAGTGGFAKDISKAVELWSSACQRGVGDACFNAANNFQTTGAASDTTGVVTLLQRGCDLGTYQACESLAERYLHGDGVPVDKLQAVSLYKKACDGGRADGCGRLALLYEAGDGGLVKDAAKAAAMFEKACSVEAAWCCSQAGMIYQLGTGGVPVDKPRALALYQRGCVNASAGSCYNEGLMLKYGMGVPIDLEGAKTAFKLGCKDGSGDKDACEELGK